MSSGAPRAGLRLTDLLARLHVFTGPLPPTPTQQTPLRTAGSLLDDALAGLSVASRASILDPVGLMASGPSVGRPRPVLLPYLAVVGASPPAASSSAPGPAARQVDETTCGAAVLAMLAMAGDPRLASVIARDPGPRFAALQRRVHRASVRQAGVPWPRALGTAPWAAAALARFGDVRYTHRVVGGPGARAVLRAAVEAAYRGVPVPLYTGGDLRGGWQAAVPRHVVLLAAGADDEVRGVVRVYEPSSATVHAVPARVLLAPNPDGRDLAARSAALGGWPHVVWAVLPVGH